MTANHPHIIFAEAYQEPFVDLARKVGRVTLLSNCDEPNLVEAVADCDALLVRTRSRVTRKVIESASRLRVIGRGGTGLDNIDLDAAKKCGIVVVHTPKAATDAAADLTVGLILNLVRKIGVGDALIKRGAFQEGRNVCIGSELNTMTLGIVGMGRIGQAVARRCQMGFGMAVLYNDIIDVGPFDFAATSVPKNFLFEHADIISLHVPLTGLTRHLINDDTLALFKHGAMLINAARGAVVDGLAVADALTKGRLAGAAFDVFDPEPPPDDHPILSTPNTLLTPHIGARTYGALERMNAVVEDVLAVLRGEPPQFPAW